MIQQVNGQELVSKVLKQCFMLKVYHIWEQEVLCEVGCDLCRIVHATVIYDRLENLLACSRLIIRVRWSVY